MQQLHRVTGLGADLVVWQADRALNDLRHLLQRYACNLNAIHYPHSFLMWSPRSIDSAITEMSVVLSGGQFHTSFVWVT
jgi:hypothetical protein